MDSENKIFKCSVCEQSLETKCALSFHTSAKYKHGGLQKSLYNHRRIAKHAIDGMAVTGEATDTAAEEV